MLGFFLMGCHVGPQELKMGVDDKVDNVTADFPAWYADEFAINYSWDLMPHGGDNPDDLGDNTTALLLSWSGVRFRLPKSP